MKEIKQTKPRRKKAVNKPLIEEAPVVVVDDKNKKKEDKIFGNSFNMGNIEIDNFNEIKIETSYARSHLGNCYDTEEYNLRKDLIEEVMVAFKASQWGEMPLTKKFSKDLMPYIFIDIYKNVEKPGRTAVDIFIGIAEFMDVSYERMYEITPMKIKEQILKELDDSYKILSKRKLNRLF